MCLHVCVCAVCKTVQIFAQATRINVNVNELTVNLAPKFLRHSLRLNLRFLFCILSGAERKKLAEGGGEGRAYNCVPKIQNTCVKTN